MSKLIEVPLLNNPVYLVIGGDGLIGKALVKKLQTISPNVYSTSRRKKLEGLKVISYDLINNSSDIFLEEWVKEISRFNRVIVIFTAAVTEIKECEKNPHNTRLVNVLNTIDFGKRIMLAGAELVFISTNAIFDDSIFFPTDMSRPVPNTIYGKQKLEAEINLININESTTPSTPLIITRLTKVISKDNPLIYDWTKKLRAGVQINAFFDILFSPISLDYAVNNLINISKKGCPGIYHISGEQNISYYEFACLLAKKIGVNTNLVNPSSAFERGKSKNYQHVALGGTRMGDKLGIISEEVEKVIDSLLK